jgi:hypothetical protein
VVVVTQILWPDQGPTPEAPGRSLASLDRPAPTQWLTDEFRPIRNPTSPERVEDGGQSERATEPRCVEMATGVTAEVGLGEIPPLSTGRTGTCRRVRTISLHGAWEWIMRPFARRRKGEMAMVEDAHSLDSLLGGNSSAISTGPAALGRQADPPETPAIALDSWEAAWYPDPSDANWIRYWNGSCWTDLVTPRPPPLSDLGAPSAPAAPPLVGPALGAETVAQDAPVKRDWLQDAERAVARAQAVDTLDSWREAAHATLVLTDMVQARLASAEAKQTAEERAEASRVAGEAAAEAKRVAERTAKAALEAAQTARAAAEAAAEAKQTAEHAAQTVPEAAQAARVAAEAAADAMRKAHDLAQAVAKAHDANASGAWSEALHLARSNGGGSDDGASIHWLEAGVSLSRARPS